MAREATSSIVQAVSGPIWARDQRQMRIVDRLLSAASSPTPRPRTRPSKRRHGTRWEGFRSILCAIDFSEPCRLALRYAAAIAARRRGALRVVYVNDPLLSGAAAVALNDRELVARSAVELRAFVHATIPEQTGQRLRISTQVEAGNPAVEILAAAEAAGADLIVVGTHGLTGARRVMLGSTTRELLRQTGVPVLAIPRTQKRKTASRSLPWPRPRIMAAIELGRHGMTEVEIAAQIAQSFNSSLVMVHVVPAVVRPPWLGAIIRGHDRNRAAHAKRRLAALSHRLRSRVPTEERVVAGRVANGLASFAVQERVSLIVVALQGRRGSWLDRRGSIAYSVLARAATPVLAYPGGWCPR